MDYGNYVNKWRLTNHSAYTTQLCTDCWSQLGFWFLNQQ